MYRLQRERPAGAARRGRSVRLAVFATLLALCVPASSPAWGGKVKLKRRYHSGRTMVYATKMQTKTEIHSDPPGLTRFLPPMPTHFTMQQQNTVTVKAVHPDGSTDIENHFDKFEFQWDLPDRVSEHLREPVVEAQQEISSHLAGQSLMAHYDRNGLLLGFEGGEGLFDQLDAAQREPLRQVVSFFLQQMVGNGIYPDHPVKPGETWKQKLGGEPHTAYPYGAEGENTLRYIGKTKVGGVKAAIVEFSFVNTLTPPAGELQKTGPHAALEPHGPGMDVRINGQGKGRALLALDDGRILQNHATLRQTMSASLKGPATAAGGDAPAMKFEIHSDTDMEVEGSSR